MSSDEGKSTAINILCIVLASICAILVSIRTYIRIRITHSYGWDDSFLILSMALAVVTVGFIFRATSFGLGKHALLLSPEQSAQVVKWNTAYQIAQISGVTATKLSILIFIQRMQSKTKYRFRATVWFVAAASTITSALLALYLAFQCYPLAKLWDTSIKGGYCSGANAEFIIGYIQTGTAVATDLFCSLSPITILWNIQVRLRRKIAICSLMSLGLAATACTIAKMSYFNTMRVSPDFTWVVSVAVILTMIEYYLGIAAACIPVVVPKLTNWQPWRQMLTSLRALAGRGSGSGHQLDSFSNRAAQPQQRQQHESVISSFVLSTTGDGNEDSHGAFHQNNGDEDEISKKRFFSTTDTTSLSTLAEVTSHEHEGV